jgi:hypothetical protein
MVLVWLIMSEKALFCANAVVVIADIRMQSAGIVLPMVGIQEYLREIATWGWQLDLSYAQIFEFHNRRN